MKHLFTFLTLFFLSTGVYAQQLISTVVTTYPSCAFGCNGSVTVFASGGLPPYQYAILPPGQTNIVFQSSNVFYGLCAGVYDVVTRDSLNNESLFTITISNPLELTFVASTTNSGISPSGVITVLASGGVPPYQYSIDGGVYQSLNVFTNLAAGSYDVSTRDANGCFIISEVIVNFTSVINSVNINGNILTANTNALSYQWINADTNQPISGETNKTFIATQSGNYRVVMTIDDSSTTIKSFNSKGEQAVVAISSPTYLVSVLGIEENDFKILKLYPNPTSDILILPITTVNKDYAIYSILGKKVSSGKILNNELSVKTLQNGLYFLSIDGLSAKFSKK